ncbi:hypothetical protein BD408DRAFT_354615 [Parasitella parasitica]|nr:hypothetical protein BD408DRAFT_354615 [Parasitella parasitica]
MDWEEEADLYHLQTLTRIRLYFKKQGSDQKSNDEDSDDEMEEIPLVAIQQG